MIEFKKKGADWQVKADLTGLDQMALVDLKVKLADLMHEVAGMIDANSAEGAIAREIARRVNNLASQAQAAGKQSAMWDDENNRFYKKRMAIKKEYE